MVREALIEALNRGLYSESGRVQSAQNVPSGRFPALSQVESLKVAAQSITWTRRVVLQRR